MFISAAIIGGLLGATVVSYISIYISNRNIKIRLVNKSINLEPFYETENASGMDLRSNERLTLEPHSRILVKTGLFISIPIGYEAQVRPRSGLALKKGIGVLNSPGTIDADYRGEIGVILVNTSNEPFPIEIGERIAQLVFNKVTKVQFINSINLDETSRGTGGFGHTGIK